MLFRSVEEEIVETEISLDEKEEESEEEIEMDMFQPKLGGFGSL